MAQSIEASGVRFFENGVVSLNLPLAQEALRLWASGPRTHSLCICCPVSALQSLKTISPWIIPFCSKPRPEVVASLDTHKASQLIGSTCSCSHSMFQTKAQRHCGRCSQCIYCRFATLAAKQQSWDLSSDYVSDVFIGPRKDPLEKAIAIDYVRHGLELARRAENELAGTFNTELSRAVRHVEGRSQTARAIISMHKRHGEVVGRVLEEQLRERG